jgi:hypothetical protein
VATPLTEVLRFTLKIVSRVGIGLYGVRHTLDRADQSPVWVTMSPRAAALADGEVDWWENSSPDLARVLAANPDLRRQRLANRLRPELGEDRPQRAAARREGVTVVLDDVV